MKSIFTELSESKLFPSVKSLDQEDFHMISEAAHLILMTLRILLDEPSTSKWAHGYVQKTLRGSDFHNWRTDGTDLYAVLHALSTGNYYEGGSHPTVSVLPFKRWLREMAGSHPDDHQTRVLFTRMDSLLRIKDASMKAVRRLVMEWPDLHSHERKLAVTRLLQMLRARTPRAEVLVKLQALSHSKDLELDNVYNPETGENEGEDNKISMRKQPDKKPNFGFLAGLAGAAAGYAMSRHTGRLGENATGGSTYAASIATVTGTFASPGAAKKPGKDTLGVGLDTNGDKGIYQNIIRR